MTHNLCQPLYPNLEENESRIIKGRSLRLVDHDATILALAGEDNRGGAQSNFEEREREETLNGAEETVEEHDPNVEIPNEHSSLETGEQQCTNEKVLEEDIEKDEYGYTKVNKSICVTLDDKLKLSNINETTNISETTIPPKTINDSASSMDEEISKDEAKQWFRCNESGKIVNQAKEFPRWFHGMITRLDSIELLKNKPIGCFLVRLSESRHGYSLSFNSNGCSKIYHYMIDKTHIGEYLVIGEPLNFPSLEHLITYYQKCPFSNWNGLLTLPCDMLKKTVDGDDPYEELFPDGACTVMTAPPIPTRRPKIPPHKTSHDSIPNSSKNPNENNHKQVNGVKGDKKKQKKKKNDKL